MNCNVNDVRTTTLKGSGVCFDKTKGKFKAYADVFGVRVRLGSTFMSADEAQNAVTSFKHSIFDSRYPLATFLCYKFDCSFNKALVFIASALKAYIQRVDVEQGSSSSSGFMFPSFAVSFVTNCVRTGGGDVDWVSVGSARLLLSIQDPVSDIIFGRASISQVRTQAHLSYDSVINQIRDALHSILRR